LAEQWTENPRVAGSIPAPAIPRFTYENTRENGSFPGILQKSRKRKWRFLRPKASSLRQFRFGCGAFGRLKIVDFEAENDEGDLTDIAGGILKHFQLMKAEQRVILGNYFRYDLRGIGGEKFLAIATKKCVNTKLICFGSMLSKIIWAGTFATAKTFRRLRPGVSQAQEEAQTAEARLVHGWLRKDRAAPSAFPEDHRNSPLPRSSANRREPQ
jgi:hypothetical protein